MSLNNAKVCIYVWIHAHAPPSASSIPSWCQLLSLSLAFHLHIFSATLFALLYPLLHLVLGLRDPVVVGVPAVLELGGHDPLEHLAGEADKVVAPQRVLEPPVLALALLAGQQLVVADLAGADAQVAHHGQQVEADLGRVVAGHAPLQHVHDLFREIGLRARPVADGRRLQAVELVQRPVDGRVGDEVKRVLPFLVRAALRLVDKGAAAREAVVHVPDQLAVGQGLAAELGREDHGELAKVAQAVADVDVARLSFLGVRVVLLVEQHAQEGLGAAGVLYRLGGEEEPLAGVVVVLAVERLVGRPVRAVGRELEEEDDAVDGVQLGEGVGV